MRRPPHRIAQRIARRWHPRIVQRFKRLEDLIVPIHLGDFIPGLIERPTLYYSVREDDRFRYVLYAVFHRNDWSELPWPVKTLDEHQFDFEGFLLAGERRAQMIVTVYHHQLLRSWHESASCPTLTIDAGGHGIRHRQFENKGQEMIYGHCRLVDMEESDVHRWIFGDLKRIFAAHHVSTPDEWAHHGRYRGWIYSRPDDLCRAFFSV